MSRKVSIAEPRVYGKLSEPNYAFKCQYEELRWKAVMGMKQNEYYCPEKSAVSFKMTKGDLCRIRNTEGAQVVTVNLWNANNPKEHFSQSLTRMYASSHLKIYDQLWSNFPYTRSMATFVYDGLKGYGIDSDGAALHDVLGPISNIKNFEAIESNIKQFGLKGVDVHDGWNAFICSGLTKSHEYFEKPSCAKKGDYVEFLAEMDLIVCLNTFIHGTFYVDEDGHHVNDEYFPVEVDIFREHIVEEEKESSNGV